MDAHAPKHPDRPGLTLLPFGGLGLDAAEVRRKASGLVLEPFPLREEFWRAPAIALDAPRSRSGYGLLLRLCRETLGS